MTNPIKIAKNVWKIKGFSNIYFLDFNKKILIDTGYKKDRKKIIDVKKILDRDKIEIVIFTHLHYDHIWNFDLFRNAEFFCSKQEFYDYVNYKKDAILNNEIADKFNINLNVIETIRDELNFLFDTEKLNDNPDSIF